MYALDHIILTVVTIGVYHAESERENAQRIDHAGIANVTVSNWTQ